MQLLVDLETTRIQARLALTPALSQREREQHTPRIKTCGAHAQQAGAAEPAVPGRRRSCLLGGQLVIGSDANFAAMRSLAAFGQAKGLANLDFDLKNQRGGY